MISDEVTERLLLVREHATSVCPVEDDIATDQWLGELEARVREARQSIDREWKRNREVIFTAKGPKPLITNLDLEDLGL